MRALLLVLWVLSWSSLGVVWSSGPDWVVRLGEVGLVAFFGLVAWWGVAGFSGYEHLVGHRILRSVPRRRIWPYLLGCAGLAAAGLVALETGQRSVLAVAVAALAGGGVLVLAIGSRLSLFATLSAVGVAIGVAALIVLRSVATGFQHEFERRVLGVYAHINVTRTFGLSEYRRFQRWLSTVPGVVGASPFAYTGMALAPHDPEGKRGGDLRRASVLVKGIDPASAGQVIDLQQHLDKVEPGHTLQELRSDLVLQPVRDRDPDQLPTPVAMTPDPRGPDAYDRAMAAWQAAPPERRAGRRVRITLDEDEWPDSAAPVAADPQDLPTAFIGSALADELDLSVGDMVVLVDPGRTASDTDAPPLRHYRVAGIFKAGFQEYDTRLVYVHIKELQHFKFRGRDEVSGIDLRLSDPNLAPEVASVLRAALGSGEYTILEWQKLNANLFQSIHTQKSVLTVILSLVGTVAGFNVLASLWTMVVRRQAEIAILMSMGAPAASVARVFQFAGLSIGMIGGFGGLLYGLLLCRLTEDYGYTLDPEVYFIDSLPVEYDFAQMGAVVAVTVAISFLATIPPALRAARLRPVEGLRYE